MNANTYEASFITGGAIMATKWQSAGLYEHPAKHQKGMYGNIALSDAGIYTLKVGGSHMSCPQDWAACIHAEETGQTGQMIIRQVPEGEKNKLVRLGAYSKDEFEESHDEILPVNFVECWEEDLAAVMAAWRKNPQIHLSEICCRESIIARLNSLQPGRVCFLATQDGIVKQDEIVNYLARQ